ncbi:pantoate--beta-alanine ligase [Serinibacter arcticus]|uniref:Pantothenate synthetase n=1 Tax=Serinibacter arcticus TaxID=1655435 RepID=A0A2U1ZUH4_9MICO|nr:pantoate--beta-alanine ligase [Serinibacter arcticus]PWD50600.1 pantoate--beta-alanine ligase [Serinibacter arcticus]
MNSQRPGRLSVGIVGAGRVGAVLGSALRQVGHEVVGASGGSPDSLDRIDTLLTGVPVLDMVDVARASDLVLLTVPDDAITSVAAWIAAQGGFRPGQIVLHTSGRHGVEVLRPALEAGAIPLAVHPAMTFTGTSLDLSRLEGAPFAVTAPAPVQPIGQALVVEIGGEPVLLADAARGAYHAALSHASNHLVTLLVQARRVLEEAGVDDGARLLGPLTRAALEGALTAGEQALTGPVSRGDVGTVSGHLDALAGTDDALATGAAYRALARSTALLAREAGRISDDRAAELERLLREHPGPALPAAVATAAGTAVVRTRADLRAARARLGGRVAVVMTMGALHEGHLGLVRAARTAADHVIVTIFVNPTQFGDPRDLEAYPRTLEGDLAALGSLGPDAPDLVFAPGVAEMYPDGVGERAAGVVAGPVARRYEGASRPGHFDGVLTVVAKLLHLTQPDVAVFGEKDAQQLAVVRGMVAELAMPLWVLAAPVAREADGLAMSSRNARLTPSGREQALALSRSVVAARRIAGAGGDVTAVLRAARAEVTGVDGVALDYADLVTPTTFLPAGPDEAGELTYVVAAVVDGVRLIDTTPLVVGGAVGRDDAGEPDVAPR